MLGVSWVLWSFELAFPRYLAIELALVVSVV